MVKFAQQLEVVGRGFPKTKTNVYYLLLDALLSEAAHSVLKPVKDLSGDVFVGWPLLHGRWRALHVHDGIRGIELRDDLGHVGITGPAEDVIDHKGACFEGFERHLVVKCVHAYERFWSGVEQAFDGGFDALPLLVCTYVHGTRTGRLAPNIKYVGACGKHALTGFHCGICRRGTAAFKE